VDDEGYGFRVPALLVSPYAPQGAIDSTTLEYTSVLRFIEENWGLEPLTPRDALANSIASGFDFDQPPRPPHLVPAQRRAAEEARATSPAFYQFAYVAVLALTVAVLIWGRRILPAAWRRSPGASSTEESKEGRR